ncbi:hypothetical protein [Echinimonas agarilytica]|uniref:Uncharacterized protein n=1 Tax=Echinimonas agarilytica TaxID=1215918 RepID=A0AA42B6H8_9GAMM|nr:hypothetical protein [Echinimonas agarilytica]MCM2678446.1 hypothetical protein [Echinimonas agarilytica]
MSLIGDVKKQWVGVVSVMIATAALITSIWQSNITETNRTTRDACFEVLRELGALQQLVDQSHFSEMPPEDLNIKGWNHVLLIQDFSLLLPTPILEHTQDLTQQWQQHWPTLITSRQSNEVLSAHIKQTRMAVTGIIKDLN